MYAYYYAPYPAYPAPAFWVTDFVVGTSLAAAYEAGRESAQATSTYPAPVPDTPRLYAFTQRVLDVGIVPAEANSVGVALTPQIKDQIADEVKLIVQQEGTEAQTTAAKQDVDPGASNVVQLFNDGKPHVFIAGEDLDLTATSGQECSFSVGDVLRVAISPGADSDTVNAMVLAGKNGNQECRANTSVSVAVHRPAGNVQPHAGIRG